MEAKLDRLVKSLIDYAYNAGSLMSEEKLHLLRLIEVDGLTAAFWSLADAIEDDELQLPQDLLEYVEKYASLIDEDDCKRILAVQHRTVL